MNDQDPFDPDYAATLSAELVMVTAQTGTMVEDGEPVAAVVSEVHLSARVGAVSTCLSLL